MKKILILTLEYPPQIGGIASYVKNFAVHCPPENTVVYAPKMEGDKKFDARYSFKVYRRQPFFYIIWPRWLKMYFQVKKIVKNEKIEEIYVEHALPGGYAAYLIKKSLKIPYVLFFHGTDLELALNNKIKKLKMICNAADKVVVSSEFLKTKFLAKVECEKIAVVNPSPSDIFLSFNDAQAVGRIKSTLSLNGKRVMISVSRLDEGKGFPHLVRFLPKILKRVPNLVWVVVGDGQKKNEIIKMVADAGLSSVVRFVGMVEHENLPVYYQSADLFVLLTHRDEQVEEGWGTVFLEAAASGLPVVAGRAGGSEETILHKQTGMVVDLTNEEGLIEVVVSLLNNTELAKKMGAAGRERVAQDFVWEKQVQKILL